MEKSEELDRDEIFIILLGINALRIFSKSTKGIFSVKKRVKLVNHWSELPYFNLTTTIKRVSHFQQDVRLNCPMKYIVIQVT